MKIKLQNYITLWENRCYSSGIPDEAPFRLEQLNKVPSYRRIVRSILSNDSHLEKLGFSKPKCKAYSDIKFAELTMKGKIKPNPQLKLNL